MNALPRASNIPVCVCVFAGATGGIGAGTLEKMTAILREPTLYALGRSSRRFASQMAQVGGPQSWLQSDFHSGRDLPAGRSGCCMPADIGCREKGGLFVYESWFDTFEWTEMYAILPRASIKKVLIVNVPQVTKEGLEICFALSYYSRMRLTSNLLPLLSQTPQPKILGVLNGGNEKTMIDNDLGLEKNWSPLTVINHTTTMTSLAFDYLANDHKQATFMHVYPGWVQTDIFARLAASESSGILWRITLAAIRSAVAIIMTLFGISAKESGQRNAYCFMSDSFGPGSWRIDNASEKVISPGVLGRYREGGWPEKIWDYTVHVFERALSREH